MRSLLRESIVLPSMEHPAEVAETIHMQTYVLISKHDLLQVVCMHNGASTLKEWRYIDIDI